DGRDMSLQGDTRIGVKPDLRRLADPHVVEVGLLEVRLYIGTGLCDEGEHRQAGNGLLAQLQPVGLSNASGNRRAYLGAAKRQVSLCSTRFGGCDLRVLARNGGAFGQTCPRFLLLGLSLPKPLLRLRNGVLGSLVVGLGG